MVLNYSAKNVYLRICRLYKNSNSVLFHNKPINRISPKPITQIVTKTQKLFFQKGYCFSEYKRKVLVQKIHELGERVTKLQSQLLEANNKKQNIASKINQLKYEINILKVDIKKSPQPNQQIFNKIELKEAELSFIKGQQQIVLLKINEIKKEKEQLQKGMNQLLQNDDKKKKAEWSSIHIIGFVVFGLIIAAYQTSIARRQEQSAKRQEELAKRQEELAKRQDKDTTQYQEEQALLNYNVNQNFNEELANFVDESPMQDQIIKIIQKPVDNKVLLVAGCPGVGKSTSIKHIIQGLRENNNKDVYYINLKKKKSNVPVEAKKLDHLLEGIYKKYDQNKQAKKSVKLIIDDINLLQQLGSQLEYQLLFKIFSCSTVKYLQIICISSSSKYIEKIDHEKRYTPMKKSCEFVVIQDLNLPKYDVFIKNLIKKYCPSIKKGAQDHMIQNKYLPRDITDVAPKLNQIEEEQEQISHLKEIDLKFKADTETDCDAILPKEKSPRVRAFLQKITGPSDQLQIGNCRKLQSQINSLYPYQKDITPIIDELDKSNMIIFCRPRGDVHRNAFKKYSKFLADLEKAK